MGEEIYKEFEEFQKQLEIRNKKLKPFVKFENDEKIDDILDELKDKEVVL